MTVPPTATATTTTATATATGTVDPAPSPTAPPRRGARRRKATALLIVAVVAAAVAGLAYAGSAPTAPPRSLPALARADATAFLHRYLAADGRVVRRDQGGDTVSEGQGYAMLLAVATGDRRAFARAWRWDRDHLQQGDGLFAYRWQAGRVTTAQPAADADLDTAWALLLAAARFHEPAYRTAGLRVAAAVLATETATVAGRLQLAAGPWAVATPVAAPVATPVAVDPSYLAPEAVAAVGRATGDHRWSALATDGTALLRRFRLPPDWVDLSGGAPRAVGTPTGRGRPVYGLDAQRSPVWLAASCDPADRAVAAADWPLLDHLSGHGAATRYTLSGHRLARAVNPLGWVATASAAMAAGHRQAAVGLLGQADRQAARYHTYYGDAWVALGRVLLTTGWLSGCPAEARFTSG
ncbi:MAG TPA: glycosyl hydrolase family 8 [Acidimicrobiales bacterium]|nr:glycosyl hydrolase family 8 [Acidimicrobiales bacterium]